MTHPSDSYRVGIAGLGKIAHRHALAINRVAGLSLVSCFDHNQNAHAEFQTASAAQAFTDFDQFLSSVDCAVICLPSFLHAEYGMRCASAGKPFLLEKPIDIQVEPARQLVAACSEAALVSGVVSQHRYCPTLNFCDYLISTGALGKISTVKASVHWFRADSYYASSPWRGRKEYEPGGVLINQAVHAIDVLRWWFGKPTHIGAVGGTSRPLPFDAPDWAECAWEIPDNITVLLSATTAEAPGSPESYIVIGSEGLIRIEGGAVVELSLAADASTPPLPCSDPVERFVFMYKNWVAALRGTERLLCDLQQGLDTLEMIDMARSFPNNAKGSA